MRRVLWDEEPTHSPPIEQSGARAQGFGVVVTLSSLWLSASPWWSRALAAGALVVADSSHPPPTVTMAHVRMDLCAHAVRREVGLVSQTCTVNEVPPVCGDGSVSSSPVVFHSAATLSNTLCSFYLQLGLTTLGPSFSSRGN